MRESWGHTLTDTRNRQDKKTYKNLGKTLSSIFFFSNTKVNINSPSQCQIVCACVNFVPACMCFNYVQYLLLSKLCNYLWASRSSFGVYCAKESRMKICPHLKYKNISSAYALPFTLGHINLNNYLFKSINDDWDARISLMSNPTQNMSWEWISSGKI